MSKHKHKHKHEEKFILEFERELAELVEGFVKSVEQLWNEERERAAHFKHFKFKRK